MKKILMISTFLLIITISQLFADCEMMGMIAKKGHYISWLGSKSGDLNDPGDFFQFLRNHSNTSEPNDDGYGVIYYPENGDFFFEEANYFHVDNQAWYKTSRDSIGVWHYPDYPFDGWSWYDDSNSHWQWGSNYEPLDEIIEPTIMDNDTKASIVLGHDRQGTGGKGNHPFRLTVNGTDYTFEHNGNVGNLKDDFFFGAEALYSDWFNDYESNWDGSSSSYSDWIDSELYFHYLIANIEYVYNGDVIKGIYNALDNIGILGTDTSANFILSDGVNVYAYKATNGNDYNLSFQDLGSFWGITSEDDLGNEIPIYNLAIFTPYGNPEIIYLNNFTCDPFFSGTVTNATWDNLTYITGNVTVPANVTLNIDCPVNFLTNSDFTVNGNVNLQDDASFNLNHATSVYVESGGEFFLDWGSTVKGTTPTTYEATPPGHQVGGEAAIHGDRIIAQNGGIITTKTETQYNSNPGPEITIEASPNGGWDGIFIETPNNNDEYWFVNCDISGIQNLSIDDLGLGRRSTAYLNLHQTDFHDAGQIVVRDDHHLTMHGNVNAEEYCYIQSTPAYPIYAYGGSVDLNYVHIGGLTSGDNLENGGGVSLYDSSINTSIIENCNILHNNGDGLRINGVAIDEFKNNNIENNTRFGMLCYEGSMFNNEYFIANTLRNNGYAEYAGWEDTFQMNDSNADIFIDDNNYGSSFDQYLLININWNGSTPVDISGTNLTPNDLPHLSPSDPNAWIFGGGSISIQKEMLYTASSDMGNEDYVTAEQTLQQIISNYSLTNEAGIAVYYLYHLENLTDQDFTSLISYLDNLNAPAGSSLESAIKKIITKCFIKDKEYLIAIDRLETVINNSQTQDEIIAAMIDQGYCYMELTEAGERGLPARCSVKTANLDEYQTTVRELETQFSFYPQEQEDETSSVNKDILVSSNYPNPFNPTTTINFNLPSESNVSVEVYNVKGQKVKTLVNHKMIAGNNSVVWNGNDSNGNKVSSGIYFYKVSTDQTSVMKKIMLLK